MNEVIVRAPTLDDAQSVAALLAERDRVDFDEARPIAFTGEELRDWWQLDEAHLKTDAWVADLRGEIVAYARAYRERDLANLADESCVHPAARGLGIGSHLLDLAQAWAEERGLGRLHVHVVNDAGRRLVETRGHELVRYFWRMEIDLAQLWRLAFAGDEMAGAVLCFGERDLGWVLDLAVGSPWRRRGLGLALLRSGFRALWRRGQTHVGLEVDSENETGATRLYERAGMHITRRYATYEKALA